MERGEVVTVVVGPGEHGVVRHALAVAKAAGSTGVRIVDRPAATIDAYVPEGAGLVHVHYTDRLFGPDAGNAAGAFLNFAGRDRRPLLVTLHDVPHPGGTPRDRRRVDGYRLVAHRATALVVSSDHERRMVEASAIGGRVTVIPLPIDAADSHPSRRMGSRRRRTVAVLGFIYPGKGHGDVVEALAELPGDVELLALGRASDGHDALAAALVTRAERMGRDMRVTGFLPDATLSSLLRSVDVPVVPAATTSASATLGTWIAAGRRPLAASNPYTTEVAAAAPGLVHLYQPDRPGALGDAVATALDDPAATWHSATVPASFTPAAVGARHRRLYRRLLEASCAR